MRKKHPLCRKAKRSGKILVLVAICLPTLVGMAALIFDLGVFFSSARSVQAVADSAATLAAKEKQNGKSDADATQACENLLLSNSDLTNATIVVRCPPTAGAYAGSTSHVEVEVIETISTKFIHWLGNADKQQVIGRAVAGYEPSTAGAAIVVLDPNPPPFQLQALPILPTLPSLPAIVGGLEVLGIGRVDVDGAVLCNNTWGGVDENGDQIGSPSGLLGLSHSVSCMPVISLSKLRCRDLRVTGGVDRQQNYAPYVTGQPAPLSAGRLPVPDPLSQLPVPTTSVDPSNVKATTFGGKTIVGLPLLSPPVVLSPGVYEWIEILSGRVQFEPGVYVIRGKHPVTQLSLCMLAGQVNAQGVMFYISDSASYSAATGMPDALDANNSPPNIDVATLLPAAIVNMGLLGSSYSGITDAQSPFKGMLLYQRRHDRRPIVLVQENLLGPGVVKGTVYSKWGHVILAGKGPCEARFVAGTMRIVALLDMQIRPEELLTPGQDVYLVE